MPHFSPDELIGNSFVLTMDNGSNNKGTVLRKIQVHDAENQTNINFIVELGDGEFDEIIAYGTLCEYIDLEDANLNPEEKFWTMTEVKSHQRPLKKSHKDYKDSLYNVQKAMKLL
jgi:hypothetical protein